MSDTKPSNFYFVATAINWGAISVEWFDNPVAYQTAIDVAEQKYDRDEVDTYICGDNRVTDGRLHELWIAHHGDDGLFVETFSNEDTYKSRFIELNGYRRVDSLEFNGTDFTPQNDDDLDGVGAVPAV